MLIKLTLRTTPGRTGGPFYINPNRVESVSRSDDEHSNVFLINDEDPFEVEGTVRDVARAVNEGFRTN